MCPERGPGVHRRKRQYTPYYRQPWTVNKANAGETATSNREIVYDVPQSDGILLSYR
jgi:hypothetical protein